MQEESQAPVPEDGWRPRDTMPDQDVRILFLEGFGQAVWMETTIAQNFTTGGVQSFRVWVSDPSWLDGGSCSPDVYGMERANQEIESGLYHAIVVVDYSNPQMFQQFEEQLAPRIQKFVEKGGKQYDEKIIEISMISSLSQNYHT